MTSTKIDQKEYLKRYLSGDKDKKKKKKKKDKHASGKSNVRIIDDDDHGAHAVQQIGDDSDLFGLADEAPQIVGIIDERPPELKAQEDFNNSKWKKLTTDGASSMWGVPSGSKTTSEKLKASLGKLGSSRKEQGSDSDQSPPRRARRDSDESPPRRRDAGKKGRSPPKKSRRGSDSDESPPRRGKKDSDRGLSKKGRRSDSDESPPRKSRKDRGRDSDESPPRRKRKDSDESPPRKSRKDRDSPQRSRKDRHRKDSDESPPRKSHRWRDSPQHSRKERRRNSDHSPPRRTRRDSDQSPPRRRTERRRSDSDESPPRRVKKERSPSYARRPIKQEPADSDESPPRRRARRNSDASPPRRIKRERESPPVRIKQEPRDEDEEAGPSSSRKMTTTLDGKRAGLQDARGLKIEEQMRRQREKDAFAQMSEELSGRNAKTVVREKSGRRKDVEEELRKELEKRKRDDKKKEVYTRWGKGVKQVEDYKTQLEEAAHEMSKPLARYADDEDLDDYLKKQERLGDPMLDYIRSKKKDQDRKEGRPEKPLYKGSFPDNRFGIRPGYRWDGVDRSNGFEKKWFEMMSKKKATEEEAYKYSVEDM